MHPSKPGQWHPAGGQALSEAPVLSARAPQAQGPETLPPPSGRPVPGQVPAWGRSSGPRLWHPTCRQAPPGSLPATNHTGLAVGDRLPQPSEPSRGGREVAHVPARRHGGAVPPPHQGQAGRWRMSGGATGGGSVACPSPSPQSQASRPPWGGTPGDALGPLGRPGSGGVAVRTATRTQDRTFIAEHKTPAREACPAVPPWAGGLREDRRGGGGARIAWPLPHPQWGRAWG